MLLDIETAVTIVANLAVANALVVTGLLSAYAARLARKWMRSDK